MKLVVGVCGSGLLLCAVACSRPQAEARSAPDVQTVAVARVTRGDVSQVVTVAAEFRPYQEIDVHAKVAGYVKTIAVDVGDRVKPGQLLAVLEIPELQDDLQQDEAAVARANDEVNRAQADLDRAESAHDVTHLGAARLTSVSKTRPNLIAQQDLDEAAGRDRQAEALVSTAKAALAAARSQLDIAKANHAKTKTLFAYARITAPFAGVITHRYADTGAMIQAGTSSQTQTMPLVKLSQNNLLRLIIPVPESAVPNIRPGGKVEVRVTVLKKTFQGSVARIVHEVDLSTRTMHTEIDVPNPNLEIVPGMYAEASLALQEKRNALAIPVQALSRQEAHTTVFVVDPENKIQERTIQIGLETSNDVEVVSGLSDGQMVVVGNRSQLRPGMAVRPKQVSSSVSDEAS